MSASPTSDIPLQPWDDEVEEETRKALEAGDWAGLESYIFRPWFSPTWVLHVAVTEICSLETAEHVERLENLLGRALEEMEDCPELLAHTVGQAEDFAEHYGDHEAAYRLLLIRYRVHAKARRNGTWDAPLT